MRDSDLLVSGYCSDLNGKTVVRGVYRWNGHRALPLYLLQANTIAPTNRPFRWLRRVIAELTYDLTRVERRTWLMLLDGRSVVEIAIREKVSRSAIYERIRGSSRGHGGMITKNAYVALWWCQRLRSNLP